jgi:hypothetical protein
LDQIAARVAGFFLITQLDPRRTSVPSFTKHTPAQIRQLAAWERTQEMKAVVDHIVAETYQALKHSDCASQLS